jgi:glycosyltransferase involved in cell wall biosynthesis
MNWHLITGEYPPQPGGVSDYTFQVAHGLAEAGETVTVWCPPWVSEKMEVQPSSKVRVRRELGKIGRGDLQRVDDLLNAEPNPRRLFVQWVPHAFSRRAINYPFCRWVRRRARRHGDEVLVMVHEAFLDFSGSWKKRAAAVVQRLMMRELLASASRVWVSTENWTSRIRPYAPRNLQIEPLGVPSNIPVVDEPAASAEIKRRYSVGGGPIVGHFGTYGSHTTETLGHCLTPLLSKMPTVALLLLGRGSCEFRERFLKGFAVDAKRVYALGSQPARELSLHLSACDLMIQPYGGGISTRNGSLMACLAHSRPVVASRGRLTEPLWDACEGLVLPPENEPEAHASEVIKLLAQPEALGKLGRRSREFYHAHFAVEHVVARMMAS